MSTFFATQKIVVTGGSGFLGRHVVRKLHSAGCDSVVVPRRTDFDLRNWQDTRRLLDAARPDIIIHLAGLVGGIGTTQKHPGSSLYDNVMIGVQLMEAARLRNVAKLVYLGSVCSYPKSIPLPGREENLWDGYPEETNAPYGIAKKIPLVQSEAYRKEYGFNSICLVGANLYGPGDNFDPETSHVIPALIRKFDKALRNREDMVSCWGDGTPTRDLLFVEDCADAILLATEFYNSSEPVNLASGFEISVSELARTIANLMGFKGKIVWDTSKPSGQPRRLWDTSRAEAFGFRAKTPIEEGLKRTIDWYQSQARGEKTIQLPTAP